MGTPPSRREGAVLRWQGVVEIASEEGSVLGYAHVELWSQAQRAHAGDVAGRSHRRWEGTLRPLPSVTPQPWPRGKESSVRLRLVGSGREATARLQGDVVVDADGKSVLLWAKVTGVGEPPF